MREFCEEFFMIDLFFNELDIIVFVGFLMMCNVFWCVVIVVGVCFFYVLRIEFSFFCVVGL